MGNPIGVPTPATVSVWDITDGFVEAIQAYSEALQGTRGVTDWGGAAARVFLKDVFGKLPSTPISAEDLAKLKGLAVEANYARANFSKMTIKKTQQRSMDNCITALNRYFSVELNINLDRNAPPIDSISGTVKDFATAVTSAQRIYTKPPADLAAARNAFLAQNNPQQDYEKPWDQLNDQDVYDVVTDFKMDNATWDSLKPEPPTNLGDS